MGFCEDYKPDDKVYKIQEGFFISSQDGAQNLEELKRQKITHIYKCRIRNKECFSSGKKVFQCYILCSRKH